MREFETLLDLLEHRARETPDRVAFCFGGRTWRFRELWNAIVRFAGLLSEKRLAPGDRAILLIPNGEEFFVAFYGVQAAGGTAVPLFPGSGVERVLSIAAHCEARAVILPGSADESLVERMRASAAMHGLSVLRVDPSVGRPASRQLAASPGDAAFIQYTSGSTGTAKALALTHRMLLTNASQMIEAMEITIHDIFVSWLPVYHDMGLILMTICPFVVGAPLELLPTNLRDTSHWVDAIARRRATFTAAPDFAYRLCLKQIRDRSAHDLSSLRVALDAAEPVRARTIEDFERTFGLGHVLTPAYGLAEATVGVSAWPPGREILVDGRGVVSVGPPFRGITVDAVRDGRALSSGKSARSSFGARPTLAGT